MPTRTKNHDHSSPKVILTELAVEGTSSFVEAQRALLDLAQQEKEVIVHGVKERVVPFLPALAMTDLVSRSIDAIITLQQDLLTTASKQSLELLQTKGRQEQSAKLLEGVREAGDIFARAQKKVMDALSQESLRAVSGKHEHSEKIVKKTELKELAREAGNAFIEAQKRLLDVIGQQMNVNVDAASRAADLISPARVGPIATRAREGVKSFIEAETSLVGSLMKKPKPSRTAGARRKVGPKGRRQNPIPA